MVTENYRDFSRIAPLWSAQRRPHAGILLIPRSATKEGTEAMVEALARFATENPEGLKPYEVRWLALESR